MVTIDLIKQLRDETSVSISECKKALEESEGDIQKAKEILKKWGKEVAQKKSSRTAAQGIVDSYIHSNGRVGVLISLKCETDFVARSEDFKILSHEICMHIAAMDSQQESLAQEPWVKDQSKTIKELIDEYITKTGENIIIENFSRYEI